MHRRPLPLSKSGPPLRQARGQAVRSKPSCRRTASLIPINNCHPAAADAPRTSTNALRTIPCNQQRIQTMKKLLLTSAVLLLSSPALADKMGSNPLTPPEYNDSVRTLDEKYAALRQQRENEYASLREQKEKELAALEARITSAKEELTEALNRKNTRKIQAGLPVEIDSAPQKVRLLMEPGTVRVWPAPRPFMSAIVGSKVLDAKPGDGDVGNADLVISALEEGYGNI